MSDESEDSPRRPKRKIKKVMVVSSGSGSDSEDAVIATATRRKRLRVVSDESSDSSGSSVVCVGTRRKRALPKLRDSDSDSDTSGWATDHSDAPKPAPAAPKPTSGFASDSSEGNSDKCSICLLRFTNQEVGTPQSCEHIFCLDCITEWSSNVNTCPVDRMTFDFIVVRACAGGRVLRTEPVKVEERRPSVEMLVVEDPTVCELCGSTDNEETMLLCDGCDLGYHMQCLIPPLAEVPIDQWLCPNCDDLLDVIRLSEVDDLFSGIVDMDMEMPVGPRPTPLREPRNVRRSSRIQSVANEPSTSSGRRGTGINLNEPPTTSGNSRLANSTNSRSTTRQYSRATTHRTHRRKYKRRRTRTVIIEYEVEENGKFPVTKLMKRRVKKRKTKKRQPRTAARRTHVRASVRAKLATMRADRAELAHASNAGSGVQDLCVRRHKAGIPLLSLFGNSHQLDYFSEEEHDISEGASTATTATAAVAARPTSTILSAYRQARRKMVTIPSPPHGTSAPDILSSILESQTLLHSKKSTISISVDGDVNIKLETRDKSKTSGREWTDRRGDERRLDLSKGEDAARKAPSYPGQSRGGGGWGGGYRGNYHREQGAHSYSRGAYENTFGGGPQSRQGAPYQNASMRRDESDTYNDYTRRPPQYSHGEDSHFERNRRQPPAEARGPMLPHTRRPNDQGQQGRYSLGPPWQPYGGGGPRQDVPPPHQRHSFGGFENPLDMRMSHSSQSATRGSSESFAGLDAPRQAKPQPQPYQPLPEPPVFRFSKMTEVEKSEDEKSDSSLVIDTEKYDPTEPTNDEDSGDDERNVSVHAPAPTPAVAPVIPSEPLPIAPPPLEPPPLAPASLTTVQNILAEIDTSTINVPHNILDSAVRQVLQEHRNLIVAPTIQSQNNKSDEDSDGDCPNFSIYSATSVHIANNPGSLPSDHPMQQPQDNLEDLVQEDDDTSECASPSVSMDIDVVPETTEDKSEAMVTSNKYSTYDNSIKKKSEEEYKEKVSKRCPITTNPRNPIKIKLNTPSLIKRQVTLYDEEEEDISEEVESNFNVEPIVEPQEDRLKSSKIVSAKISDTLKENTEVKSLEKYSGKSSTDVTQSIEEKENEKNISKEQPCTPPKRDADSPPILNMDGISNNTYDEVVDGEIEKQTVSEDNEKSETEAHSEEESDDISEAEVEIHLNAQSPKKDSVDRNDDDLEKMTESISETEDERSYTPCLDENKSKDTSLETDKEKGIEGLDTEMISEDEGNEMFSDNEKQSHPSHASPLPVAPPADGEEGEILDKKKEGKTDDTKKKKKKESKKEGKEKKSKGKKGEIAFKKLSKNGKERNYRERDKDDKAKGKKERRDSTDSADRERQKQKRKEKRKDLERYDVRTLVSEKRKKPKDPFGRDISPRVRSRSPSLSPLVRRSPTRDRGSPPRRTSPSPPSRRRSVSPRRRSASPRRRSASPRRRSISPRRRSASPPRLSASPPRRSGSPGGRRGGHSASPARARPRRSGSPAGMARRVRASPAPRSTSPRAASPRRRRRRSASRPKRVEPRRRPSASRARKRRRSGSDASPKPKPTRKKKRARSERPPSRRRSPRRKSPKRRKPRRRSASREPDPPPAPVAPEEPAGGWSPGSVDSRPLSPRTPPPDPSPSPRPPADARRERRRRDPERARHRRARDVAGPSKEVFTSGDNILVSVSFKEQERAETGGRRERRRERRRRRRRAAALEADAAAPKPVAIIDLERSPFRELTPSPSKNVIVLSDSDHGERDEAAAAAAGPTPGPEPAGPKTPPEPAQADRSAEPAAAPQPEEPRGPNTPPEPPDSPDAYDPYEPTRSASGSPSPARAPPSPARPMMTLETAQKTNMSADEVIDRRPLSPIEKVMALLKSTRDVSPEPVPGEGAAGAAEAAAAAGAAGAQAESTPAAAAAPAPAPAPPAAPPVRIVLPEPTRPQPPKLFLAKPSPIKSDPIKPMQATKIARLPLPTARRPRDESDPEGDSPYSPGSSDFGDLFSPPGGARAAGGGGGGGGGRRDMFDALFEKPRGRKGRSNAAKVPVKLTRKKGKTQVDVKIDDENLKVLDDLPSSAVEMQVKSKFLKKLNRQERVVEEVKLVLKPHYNKKHVTKDEYKDILRRAVPKICHNKTGEINPTKIQALVEAYVKKFRKKHKLGLV